MLTTIDSTVKSLQSGDILPQGYYKCTSWEQRFSFIFRVTINPGIRTEHSFFFKILKPRIRYSEKAILRMLVREYEALKKVSPFFSQHEHFNIPNPVYFSVEESLLVTESLKGTPIFDIGKKYASGRKTAVKDSDILEIYSRAGSFLRVLHDSESYSYSKDDLNILIDSIKERLTGDNFTESQQSDIKEYLESCRSDIVENLHRYKKNPIHNDFAAENILCDGEDINVLDFADYRLDHAFQDLSYFEIMTKRQLESRIKYRKSAADELIRAFNKGYGVDDAVVSKDRLYHLYKFKNLIILVNTLALWKDGGRKLSPGFIKDNILKSLEYHRIKKRIFEYIRH